MSLDQFSALMFSTPELTNIIVRYLYESSVCNDESLEYLRKQHDAFCDVLNGLSHRKFENLKYQVVDNDGIVPDGGTFASVKNLVGNKTSLYGYCSELNRLVARKVEDSWKWEWIANGGESAVVDLMSQ